MKSENAQKPFPGSSTIYESSCICIGTHCSALLSDEKDRTVSCDGSAGSYDEQASLEKSLWTSRAPSRHRSTRFFREQNFFSFSTSHFCTRGWMPSQRCCDSQTTSSIFYVDPSQWTIKFCWNWKIKFSMCFFCWLCGSKTYKIFENKSPVTSRKFFEEYHVILTLYP